MGKAREKSKAEQGWGEIKYLYIINLDKRQKGDQSSHFVIFFLIAGQLSSAEAAAAVR